MVAIIGIAALVVTPYFLKSIRGNRLRTGARSVVMMGRYARSMAILHERDMALTFSVAGSEIRVQAAGAPAVTNTAADPLAALLADASSPAAGAAPLPAVRLQTDAPTGGPPPVVDITDVNLSASRQMDGVTFEFVRVADRDEQRDGIATIRYRLNGTCDPYEVRIRDQQDNTLTLSVDSLSAPRVEGGDRQTLRLR